MVISHLNIWKLNILMVTFSRGSFYRTQSGLFLCLRRYSRFRCSRTSSALWTLSAATPTWTRAPMGLRAPRRAPGRRACRAARPSRRASSSSSSLSDTLPLPSRQLLCSLSRLHRLLLFFGGQTFRCLCLTFGRTDRRTGRSQRKEVWRCGCLWGGGWGFSSGNFTSPGLKERQ